MKRTGYDSTINYNYDLEAAAEFLNDQLGREPTDEELEEFLEEQESREVDAYDAMMAGLDENI